MKKRLITIFILIAYSTILIKLLVFKDLPPIRIGSLILNFGGTQEGPANLLPFKTILPYLLGEKGFIIAFLNIAGNIVLLIPIGFLVPFVFRNMTWKKSLMLAVAAGFAIEGMQVLLHVGIFDIDDVMLNGLGVMVGYWLFIFLAKLSRPVRSKVIIITSIIVIAVVAAFYGFFVSHNPLQPENFGARADTVQLPDSSTTGAENIQPGRSDNGSVVSTKGKDPCNGTGGTGQIVSVGVNEITIKGSNGINQTIHLTDQTKIRSSAGPATVSDLKPGNGITIVTGSEHSESLTAMVVLICNTRTAGNK